MAKSKLQQEQEDAMETYTHRTARSHQRYLRKAGKGNASRGLRELVEEKIQGFVDRRKGPADRRKK